MSESNAPTQNILNIEIKKILNIVWALVISHHPIMLYYLLVEMMSYYSIHTEISIMIFGNWSSFAYLQEPNPWAVGFPLTHGRDKGQI